MSLELNLRFPDPTQVIVKFDEAESDRLTFVSPLTARDLDDLRWYLEVYAAQYTADVDDDRAHRIATNFKRWGNQLFEAVFGDRTTQRLFNDFQDSDEPGRLITISASHPTILRLPWELLRDPAGTYLVHEHPRISVRRRLAGAGGGRRALRVRPKAQIHVLFVVSRPTNAGFINPRSEAQAVLNALEAHAAGRVTVEFLRPATLDGLVQRLEATHLPAVDVLHFDGHGVYDADGRHREDAKLSNPFMLTKGSRKEAQDIGYLLFENATGETDLISAETLGDMLHRQKIGLVILSACQSAAVGNGKPTDDADNADNADPETDADIETEKDAPGVMGSLAARLTHAGIPAVLAMTHSVLVTTTRELFGQFYQNLVQGQGMGAALDNARRHLYRHPDRGTRLRGQQETVTLKLQDWFLPALYQAGADTPLLTATAADTTPTATPNDDRQGARLCAPTGACNLPDLQEAGFWGRNRELWLIERAFVHGTRRLTITRLWRPGQNLSRRGSRTLAAANGPV